MRTEILLKYSNRIIEYAKSMKLCVLYSKYDYIFFKAIKIKTFVMAQVMKNVYIHNIICWLYKIILRIALDVIKGPSFSQT